MRAIDDEIYQLLRYILPLILFLSQHIHSFHIVCMVHGHRINLSFEFMMKDQHVFFHFNWHLFIRMELFYYALLTVDCISFQVSREEASLLMAPAGLSESDDELLV